MTMTSGRRWLVALLLVSLVPVGCSPGGGGPADGDADADADGDADADQDGETDAEDGLDEFLAENGIERMEVLEDGTELGRATSGDDGVVRFYSAAHNMLIDFALANADAEGVPAAGIEVLASVGPETSLFFLDDPTNELAPMLFATEVPQENAEISVDAIDLMTEDAGLLDFDPEADDPFATPFTFGDLSVTFVLQTSLRTMGTIAALNIFKTVITQTCNYFAPVHEELCDIVGNVAYAAGSLAVGAFNIAGATLYEQVLDVIGEVLGDYVCQPAGGLIMGYVAGAQDTRALDAYREIARKYNYMLFRLESDPPENAEELRAELEEVGPQLAQVGRVVRNRYFELYNPGAESELPGLALGTLVDITAQNIRVDEIFRAWVLTHLTLEQGLMALFELTDSSVRYEIHRWTYLTMEFEHIQWAERSPWQNYVGPFADCAFNFVEGIVGGYRDASGFHQADQDTAHLVDGALKVWESRMDFIYDRAWGGTIPDGPCMEPDEYEPNETWAAAFGSPLPTVLDSGVVELPDANLCDYVGTGITENDWYAYFIAPIEFNVQARVVGIDGADGQDQPICLEMYFYSELYEIGMLPPELVAGPACGLVSEWPTIPSFGIRRTMGETWSMLLPRVYTPGPTTAPRIEYGLRFTP